MSRKRRRTSPAPSPRNSRVPPTTRSSGWSRKSSRVVTPKLPPPPRSPQRSSSFSSALAWTTDPLGVTSSAPTMLSQVRPCCAVRWPIPPPERKARYAGGADDSAGCDEPEGLGSRIEVEPGRAALRVRSPPVFLHVDPAHRRKVDHKPVVQDAVSSRIVTASPNSDLQLVRTREIEGGGDIAGVEAAHDQCGPTIDESVEGAARSVVLRVCRCENRAGERTPQIVHVPQCVVPSRRHPCLRGVAEM